MINKRPFQIVIISTGLLMAGFVIQPAVGEDGISESAASSTGAGIEIIVTLESEVTSAAEPEANTGVEPEETSASKPEATPPEAALEVKAEPAPEESVPAVESDLSAEKELAPGHITMSFKDADIRNVLRSIADKGGINIISGPEVEGAVTVQLVDVPWKKALNAILSTYGFGCERDGDIIIVTTLKKLTDKRKEAQELAGIEPVVTRVFKLKYVDAGDVAAALKNQVSERGVITVLEERGQKGWALGCVVSTRGGTHLRGAHFLDRADTGMFANISPEDCQRIWGVPEIGNSQSYENKAKPVIYYEILKAVSDSLGICSFLTQWTGIERTTVEDMAELYSAATGREITAGELMTAGRRIHNLEKAFNTLHAGFDRGDDYPPPRFMKEPVKGGEWEGEILTKEGWDFMLDEYYRFSGWDEKSGWQLRQCLDDLDLKEVADDLEKAGRLPG